MRSQWISLAASLFLLAASSASATSLSTAAPVSAPASQLASTPRASENVAPKASTPVQPVTHSPANLAARAVVQDRRAFRAAEKEGGQVQIDAARSKFVRSYAHAVDARQADDVPTVVSSSKLSPMDSQRGGWAGEVARSERAVSRSEAVLGAATKSYDSASGELDALRNKYRGSTNSGFFRDPNYAVVNAKVETAERQVTAAKVKLDSDRTRLKEASGKLGNMLPSSHVRQPAKVAAAPSPLTPAVPGWLK